MSRDRSLVLVVLWFFGMAGCEAAVMTPDQVFSRVSGSVVTVLTFDDQGRPLGQGSGVVIAPEQVATNCHVISESSQTRIETGTQNLVANLLRGDGHSDVCMVSVKGLLAPPASRRDFSTVVVGEPVVALGNPLGFGLAVSAGLVTAMPAQAASPSLIASAPVSPGSSGGGLFDLQGRLIGLTTAILGTGQSLNLVLSVQGLAQAQTLGGALASLQPIPDPEPSWLNEATALLSRSQAPAPVSCPGPNAVCSSTLKPDGGATNRHSSADTTLEVFSRRWIDAQPTSALAYVFLSSALEQSGQLERAMAAAEQALLLDAYSHDAWLNKAALLHKDGREKQAQLALDRAIDLLSSSSKSRLMQAQWLFQAKRYQAARDVASLSVRLDGAGSSEWRLLGQAEDALGRHQQAARAYRIALRLDGADADLKQKLAQTLIKQGQVDEAKTKVAGDQAGPAMSQATTWFAMGSAERDRGRLGEAQEAFRKALALAPHWSPAWNGLGMTLSRLKRVLEAEKAFDQAVQLDAQNVAALINRASSRQALGRTPQALQDIQQALAQAPSEPDAWRIYGIIKASQRQYADAADAFGKLDALHAATADDLVSFGENLANAGQSQKGLAVLRRAEQLNPRLARMLTAMAKLLGKSGDVAQALTYLDRALEVEPSNVFAWSSKGYALMRLGRLSEASDVLETAVSLDPDFANAWINLGQTQLRRKNHGRSIEALEKALSIQPDALDARLYLAEAYLNTRQIIKAKEQATAVLSRSADQHTGLGILTIVHLMEGHADEAVQRYEQLKRVNPVSAAAIKAQAVRAGLALASRLVD